MLRYLLFFVVLGANVEFSHAQANIDSLLTLSRNEQEPDTVRLLALHQIAFGFMRTNPDSCKVYAGIYERLSQSLGYKDHAANATHLRGIAFYFMGQLDSATTSLKKSLKYRGPAGDKAAKASTLNVIGAVYMQQGNHAQAMINYMACLKISEEIGDNRGISGSNHNIGRIYAQQGEPEKALSHYHQSLLHKDSTNILGIAEEYEVIGSMNADLGNASIAEEFFLKSLKLRRKAGDPARIGMSYGNLAQFYIDSKPLDTIKRYIDMSIVQFELANDVMGIAYSNITLATVFQQNNRHQEAIICAQKALDIAHELNDARLISESSILLSTSYKKVGVPKKALEMYELHISTRDSIKSEENQREVLRQEYSYQYEKEALSDSLEFAKKEAVLQEKTEKQRIGLAASGGGLLLLLALAFAIYSGKKKSDELLLNILPAETAEELKKNGESEAKLVNDVTVIFTDFKGFTAMSEILGPKELVQDIHECFSEFDRIMEKYGVEKIKTIGDAYMAACGLPSPTENHAKKAVLAAFEMRDFVESGKARKVAQGLPFFEIRIGVHTGPVVAGIVGIKKFQYDIWGDTVNTASRMESSGEVGKVNISGSTYELVKNEFTCEHRGKVKAKGKGELDMYFVETKPAV